MSELVQPIVLAEGGTHAQSIRLAALAAVSALVEPVLSGQAIAESWQPWIDAGHPVLVRGLSPGAVDEVHQWAAAAGLDHSGRWGEQVDLAVALQPIARQDLPRVVAKAPQEEVKLDRGEATTDQEAGPRIEVLGALPTGAAATAAATLLWQWVAPKLTDAPEGVAEWFLSGAGLTIDTGIRPQDLGAEAGDLHYRDAGDSLVAVLRAR